MKSQTKEILNDISNKRDFYKHKLKMLSQTKEIRKINIVKDYGVCFVIVERWLKRLIAFCIKRDKCFVFQTLDIDQRYNERVGVCLYVKSFFKVVMVSLRDDFFVVKTLAISIEVFLYL